MIHSYLTGVLILTAVAILYALGSDQERKEKKANERKRKVVRNSSGRKPRGV